MPKPKLRPADFIVPLNMNGLQGRMLHMPAPPGKKREILLVYGHHSSLERWFGLAQVFNKYGAVTMPDLPGFGGMQSFYRIDKKPTINNMADYLASFVKMRYKRRRVTIVGMSYGFLIATRMLQRFPDLEKRVDLLVSLVGFAHKDDFIFSKPRYWAYRLVAFIFQWRGPARFFKLFALHPYVLRKVYGRSFRPHAKFADIEPGDLQKMLDVEIWLWRNNEVRTHMYTSTTMLKADNCQKQIDLPVWHVGVKNDHFLDNHLVEQHLRVVYSDFHGMRINLTKHAPTVIAEARDAAPFLPSKLRKVLNRPS